MTQSDNRDLNENIDAAREKLAQLKMLDNRLVDWDAFRQGVVAVLTMQPFRDFWTLLKSRR